MSTSVLYKPFRFRLIFLTVTNKKQTAIITNVVVVVEDEYVHDNDDNDLSMTINLMMS